MTVSIRELRRDEFIPLAEFLAAHALPRFNIQEYLINFDVWWLKNPYFKSGDPYGWVIVDNDRMNYIQGFLGSIPADYRYGGKCFTTVSPTTWCVVPEYRKYALQLFFAFYRQAKDIMVNSTASDVTREISLKFGCIDIAKRQKTLMKPLSIRVLLFAVAKRIKMPSAQPVVLFLRMCLFLFRLYEKLLRYMYMNVKQAVISEVSDVVSIRGLQQAGTNLYIEDMSWIIQNDKDKKLLVFHRKGQDAVTGYILVQFVKNRYNGLNYIQVLDSANITLPVLNKIVENASEFFPSKEIDCVLFPNCSFERYRRYGYTDITRFMPSTCLIYGDRISEIKDAGITAVFGEKGFILWHS